MPRKTDKRVRLIEAAKVLIHQKGFNETTLADIAQEADVPLGNVYYYFKTKEAIGEAVIERREVEQREYLAEVEKNLNPKVRLATLFNLSPEELELTARFGCATGGLCQELGKQGGTLANQAAKLLHDLLGWSENQFRAMGYADKSADLALNLISQIQGMFLLTHTFKDPKFASRQAKMANEWLDKLAMNAPKSGAVRQAAMEEVA
jgi:TetR/AcrR family transcriptional regulator, transcriptional repressor for nem operon